MKKAVCIGCNYPGTEFELQGCVNDVEDMAKFLRANGFDASTMIDAAATKRAIITAVTQLLVDVKAGDVGLIHFSGHGTWMPDLTGVEPDKRAEALCPIDMGSDGGNLIFGNDFHLMFNKINPNAHIVFLTDACHSGTVFRFMRLGLDTNLPRKRFVPPSHLIRDPMLFSAMQRAYGQPASAAKPPLPGLAHFSGCRDSEYSNDAVFDDRPNGAFTYYAVRAFDDTLKVNGTYVDAWESIRKSLPSQSYSQSPQLNALPDLQAAPLFS